MPEYLVTLLVRYRVKADKEDYAKYLVMGEQTEEFNHYACDFISAEHLICTELDVTEDEVKQ